MLGLAGIGFVVGRMLLRPSPFIEQPIAFNHSLHVDVADCETCHVQAQSGAHSGLPGLSVCLECHEDPMTDSEEELKIAELAAAGPDQVFRKLFRMPDNVFYTHRRHVGIAGLECVACHGGIADTETPPTRPLVNVTMGFCIDCHDRSAASVACTACHR